MRVGLLGGSFDPVHYGHLRAAEWALENLDLQDVRLIPARQSPFKNDSLASAEDRLAMLRLATADHPALSVETCELERDPPSYMVDTLKDLTSQADNVRFVLILGSDAAAGLDQWRDSDEVKRLAEIRVLNRPGDGRSGDDPRVIGASRSFEGLPISSTGIRADIREGRSIRYLTPEPVRKYIEEKRLYK